MRLVIQANSEEIEFLGFGRRKNGTISVSHCSKSVEEITDEEALRRQLRAFSGRQKIESVSFRILFGADHFSAPALINREFFRKFERLVEFFPFYIPFMINLLKLFQRCVENAPLIAFFETSFFLDLPDEERFYALPYEYHKSMRIRKWGYHGIYHQACGEIFTDNSRTVSIVLDRQTTVAAITRMKPCSISLGYTPLEGVMSRRSCGDMDPGVAFYLMRKEKASIYKIDSILKNESGFLGLTGYDLKIPELARLYGRDRKVNLAFEIYLWQILKYVGEGMAVMGGVDNIIFSGSYLSSLNQFIHNIVKKVAFLGVNLNSLPWESNNAIFPVSASGSKVNVYINRLSQEEILFHNTEKFLDGRKVI